MYFFKYQRPGNLELSMLRRGEIFFASVAELNDASECRPRFVLNGIKELWIRLAHFVLQGVCLHDAFFKQATQGEAHELLSLSEALGTAMKMHAGKRDIGLEALDGLVQPVLAELLGDRFSASLNRVIIKTCSKFIQREIPLAINETMYLASFSMNAKNPTMWGHYADAERGFVIVYSTDDQMIGVQSPIKMLHGVRPLDGDRAGAFELGVYRDDRLTLKVVKYTRMPPKANAFQRLIPKFSYTELEHHYDLPLSHSGDVSGKEESQIGLVKYSDWRYEKEVRAFLPTRDCLPPDARVLQISTHNIRGLIFGPSMTARDKERAVLCCHLMRESSLIRKHQPLPEFAFFQAIQVVDRFDLQISPVGVLDGPYFGSHFPIKTMSDLDETTKRSLRKMIEEFE